MASNPFVFDVVVNDFESLVLTKSQETPILVDFWATWCGPCRTLGPILEKLAAEYNGAFLLAKIDVDRAQSLAAYFQIRSVPTVMLIKDGQILDGFSGALPESQLRRFLSHHGIEPLPSVPDEPESIELSLTPEEQVEAARSRVLAEPDKPELRLDLIEALLQAGQVKAAETELEGLPDNLVNDDRTKRARSRLEFTKALQDAPSESELAAELAANPNNLCARHQYGVHRLLAGDHQAALESFLAIMRADRTFGDDLGRKSLIAAFALIDDQDLISRTRKQMAAMLF